jgi:hypothetical protein
VEANFFEMKRASVTAVIRSAGERTELICLQLLGQQLAEDQIRVVREVPFERALLSCYEIGINSGSDWLLTLDADVLLLPNAVECLIAEAQKMPGNFCQVEGFIFDNIFRCWRPAGNRVYRVAHLPQAIRAVPPPGAEIRPERAVLQAMAWRGHPSRRVALRVGLHDFEQYYRDLYRKAYVHAQKHSKKVLLWAGDESPAFDDAELAVVRRGFRDGAASTTAVKIDKTFLRDAEQHALQELGVVEKHPLVRLSGHDLDSIVETTGARRLTLPRESDVLDTPPHLLHRLEMRIRYALRWR